ncbi:unnamed protein product [Rangifer tarandus platyrhynchus]|uniref:Uncharacterized protein n=1 Tax=Rangifer tarandus platyrhynchus TaxID=3082113 RepID=A0AC60A3S9_RANTA
MLLKVVDLRKTNYVTADDNVFKSISYDSEELFNYFPPSPCLPLKLFSISLEFLAVYLQLRQSSHSILFHKQPTDPSAPHPLTPVLLATCNRQKPVFSLAAISSN